MVKARVTLQNLKTLSYNFPTTNFDLAKEFTEQLDQLYQSFYAQLPNEAGLVVLQESLRSTKRREKTKRPNLSGTYASLPPQICFNKKGWHKSRAKEENIKPAEGKYILEITDQDLCLLPNRLRK